MCEYLCVLNVVFLWSCLKSAIVFCVLHVPMQGAFLGSLFSLISHHNFQLHNQSHQYYGFSHVSSDVWSKMSESCNLQLYTLIWFLHAFFKMRLFKDPLRLTYVQPSSVQDFDLNLFQSPSLCLTRMCLSYEIYPEACNCKCYPLSQNWSCIVCCCCCCNQKSPCRQIEAL